MKRIHKIILCLTLLSVLICTTVFSASASYVASERPSDLMIRSVVETNSADDGSFYYYDYGVVNFEDNDFSGQPIFFTEVDETYDSSFGYDSYVRITQYLLETEENLNLLYYDLDSYISAETVDDSTQIDYYIHSVEFNLTDFKMGWNNPAMDNLSCYVFPDEDIVDNCYFDGKLRFPFGNVYEEYTPDGDFYVGDYGLKYVDFEFIPYQANQTAQPFVETGKTVFTDFSSGDIREYESVPFTLAVKYYFRDAYGMSSNDFYLFSHELEVCDGCYRMEFGGEVTRDTTSMSLSIPYLYEQESDNFYSDSFRVPMFPQEVEVEPFEWLLQSGQAALEFELLPNLTVGHILLVMLAIPILIAALRLLAGG